MPQNPYEVPSSDDVPDNIDAKAFHWGHVILALIIYHFTKIASLFLFGFIFLPFILSITTTPSPESRAYAEVIAYISSLIATSVPVMIGGICLGFSIKSQGVFHGFIYGISILMITFVPGILILNLTYTMLSLLSSLIQFIVAVFTTIWIAKLKDHKRTQIAELGDRSPKPA